jgi:lactobin A/cerein 7B family class IIb bacteriocin
LERNLAKLSTILRIEKHHKGELIMQELSQNELDAVEGGIAPIIVVGGVVAVALVCAIGVGIYNGYQDAKAADAAKAGKK